MVGRGDAAPGQIGEIGAGEEGVDLRVPAQVDDRHRRVLVAAVAGADRPDRPAQGRQHIARRHRRRGLGAPGGGAAMVGQPGLDRAGLLDQPPIGTLGIVGKGKVAVIEQDQPLDLGVCVKHIRRRAPERESRLEEGHHPHAPAENLADHRFGLGQVGKRDHRGGVAVVDELVRQEGVQQGLDRRVGAGRVQHGAPEGADHLRILEPLQLAQGAQRSQAQARHPSGRDPGQIVARALHMQHFLRRAEEIRPLHLDRRIAAPVQHQIRVGADQTRGINLLQKRASGGIFARFSRKFRKILRIPPVFHHVAPVRSVVACRVCLPRSGRAEVF